MNSGTRSWTTAPVLGPTIPPLLYPMSMMASPRLEVNGVLAVTLW